MLYLNKTSPNQRFICTFEPYHGFFEKGIDMDDALSARPHCFKVLRAFWKLSFIKLDDEEAKCLVDVLLKDNFRHEKFKTKYVQYHSELSKKLNDMYLLDSKNILSHAVNNATPDNIKHEMAIEAGIIDQICRKVPNTVDVFFKLDYISHQVIASPFKPIDYIDKIDVFGYSYILGTDTIERYCVIELKKDKANKQDINQLLKYVDWVKDEYAGQDYSSISAYLVAYDFTTDSLDYLEENGKRNYTYGRRPIVTDVWKDISLVEYRFDTTKKELVFKKFV